MTHTHSGGVVVGASLALVFWSYIPLYALPFAISSCLLKIPIEVCVRTRCPRRSELTDECIFQERTMVEDPVLGDQYKRYRIKVPYRLIPYIW